MSTKRQCFMAAAAVTLLVCPVANGMELVLMASDSMPMVIEVPETLSLQDLQEHLESLTGTHDDNWLLFASRNPPKVKADVRGETGYSRDVNEGARDYYLDPTEEDKGNIGYVVKTLANKSEVSLLLYSTAVQTAGDNVKHVHPLRFLGVIFEDEELKVGIRNVRKKSMVWKRFRAGIAESLSDEHAVDNMKDAYLVDFCNKVGVDIKLVLSHYQKANWREFIETLVTHVPRKGDYRRYDM